MLQLLLTFFALAAVIVAAGTFLSKYADAIAGLTGLGRTLGGMLLLASATSLPELSVDCKAALIGAADMAVGAVLGSSIFNLLIIGVLDLCRARHQRVVAPVSAHHALSAICTIILSATVLTFILLKEFQLEWMSVGLGSLVTFLVYLASLRLIYLDHRHVEDGSLITESEEITLSLPQAVLGYSVATVVIVVAASFLAPTADRLAAVTGLGGTFVGSTFVALTTSLPEVVTTAAALRMGAFDLAIGNVLGSNAFNMAILFPADCFYRQGSLLHDAEMTNAITAAAGILLTAVMTLGFLYRPQRRYWILDPDAGLLVLLAAAVFVALYYLTPAAS